MFKLFIIWTYLWLASVNSIQSKKEKKNIKKKFES